MSAAKTDSPDIPIPAYTLGTSAGRWILITTMFASGTSFLVGSAVSVALPAIQSHFGSNLDGIQWVTSAYLLPLAALLLIGGSLGDHYGRKRIFIIGLILFSFGATLSGLADNIWLLAAFQVLMGVGSALMVPQSLAILVTAFAATEQGRVIGLWAGLSGVVAAAGPWVGGSLVEILTWRAVFLALVPIGLLLLLLALKFLPENSPNGHRRPNWSLAALIFLGFSGFVYALINAPTAGFGNPLIVTSFIGSVLLVSLFLALDRRQAEPMLPTTLFQIPLIAGANIATLLLYFSLNGVIFFTVLNLQQIQDLSPLNAGLGLMPPVIIITLLAGPFGALADKLGPRRQMVAGPLIAAAGIGLLSAGTYAGSYVTDFLPGLALLGLGMAVVIAPLTKSALAVTPEFSGAASGLNNSVARVAGLLAVAVLGLAMALLFSARLDTEIANSDLSVTERQEILNQAARLGAVVIPEHFTDTARLTADAAVSDSFISSYRWTMGLAAATALGAAITSFFGICDPERPNDKSKSA